MMCLNVEVFVRMISLLLSFFFSAELLFFMMCLSVEVSVRMKSMSSFDKFRVFLSSLLSERLLREMSFFMNCLICFVVEVSVRMKSMSLLLMSSFCKFRLSLSFLISGRLLTLLFSMLWVLFMIMKVIGVISFLVLSWCFVLEWSKFRWVLLIEIVKLFRF